MFKCKSIYPMIYIFESRLNHFIVFSHLARTFFYSIKRKILQ